jgi:hypothetical protein
MTDADIRQLLRPHAQPTSGDGALCSVDARALDPALDRNPIRAWVERQEHGRVERRPAIQSRGLRLRRRVASASNYVPVSERYVFPIEALDGD